MLHVKNKLMLSTIALLSMNTLSAGEISMQVEEPIAGTAYSGVANLRGWAVSTAGVDRVELYVDDVFITNVPAGASRGDVGALFPQIEDASSSGFSMALNYSLLTSGEHKITIRVLDKAGDSKESEINFSAQAFNTQFVSDARSVNVDSANFSANGNALQLSGLMVEGQAFDTMLEWRTGAQGFRFKSINMSQNGGGGGGDGQCVNIPLTPSGTKITWVISGSQNGQSVMGTINTHYTSITTTKAETETTSSITTQGFTTNTNSTETQQYKIENNFINVVQVDTSSTTTVQGFDVTTTTSTKNSPALLLGPANVFCLNQTWTSASVTQTTTVNGITTVAASQVRNGVVESIDEVVSNQAGTFTTVKTKVTFPDNSTTTQWLAISNGVLVKQESRDAAGALFSTDATSIQ